MDEVVSPPLYSGLLLVGMLLLFEAGRRAGARRLARDPAADTDLGPVEGAIFALFGLLVAFTFSGAAQRYDTRRLLIAEEANDIGTAYLRLDLLPEASQPALRAAFRDYLGSRLETYRRLPDLAAAKQELTRSEALQRSIWSASVAATRLEGGHPDAAWLLLPALNAMIDITTTRTMSARIHPPTIIYRLLFMLALSCAFLSGYGRDARKPRSWIQIVSFLLTTVIALYVILDLEHPRAGFFRITAYDQVLVDLLKSMQ